MRVTNRSTTRNYLKYLNDALGKQQATMKQIESGYRVSKISDDVANGVKNMRAKESLYKANVYKSNISSIQNTLDTVESAMTEMHDLFNDLHTKLLKAASETSSTTDRQIYGQQFATTQSEILQLLNTKYDGKYLFGGSNNASAPFTTDASGALLYNGVPASEIKQRSDGTYYFNDPGQGNQAVEIPMNDKVYMDIGLGLKMTGPRVDPETGFDVSYSGPDILGFGTANGGQQANIFNVVNQATTILKNATDSSKSADTKQMLALGDQLQTLNDRFLTQITDVGAKKNFLETISGRLDDTTDALQERMANLVGTDSAQAAKDSATDVAVVNALYRLGSSLIPSTLMDFIR